jgi:hypothetical protein
MHAKICVKFNGERNNLKQRKYPNNNYTTRKIVISAINHEDNCRYVQTNAEQSNETFRLTLNQLLSAVVTYRNIPKQFPILKTTVTNKNCCHCFAAFPWKQ